MLTSLFMEVRIWPLVWRRRLANYWLFGDKELLAFLAALVLLILAALGLISLAYLRGTRLEPARLEAIQQQETTDR